MISQLAHAHIDHSILERNIRINLITDKDDDPYISQFKYLVRNMVISQTNIYNYDKTEYVCYESNGLDMHNWAFYLNQNDNTIWINDEFWKKYNSIFDLVNLEYTFIYFKILILAFFDLERKFDDPFLHISMKDEKISLATL